MAYMNREHRTALPKTQTRQINKTNCPLDQFFLLTLSLSLARPLYCHRALCATTRIAHLNYVDRTLIPNILQPQPNKRQWIFVHWTWEMLGNGCFCYVINYSYCKQFRFGLHAIKPKPKPKPIKWDKLTVINVIIENGCRSRYRLLILLYSTHVLLNATTSNHRKWRKQFFFLSLQSSSPSQTPKKKSIVLISHI